MPEMQSHGLNPWVGKIPGEGNCGALQYFCLRNPMGRVTWWATVHGLQRVRHDWETELLPRLGAKYSSKSEHLPYPLHIPPTHTHSLSHYDMLPRTGTFHYNSWTFISHQNHPKSMVYTGIHSWCCTLYRHKDAYPPLQYLMSVFKAQVNIRWMPIVWHPDTTFHIFL